MRTILDRPLLVSTTTAVLLLPVLALGAGTARAEAIGAIISNGTVSLGVNANGQLNHGDEAGNYVGVTYVPTGNDGTRAGCACEGWGAGNGDPGDPFEGGANEAAFGGPSPSASHVSFASTATTATSVTLIDNRLQVTHSFAPAPETPDLYEVVVTLQNVGVTAIGDLRYTRSMDWDVEPTEFQEFVTIQRGSTPAPAGNLLYSSDDGFANSLPLSARNPIDPATQDADFVDNGPSDHGAVFDLGFGPLAAGESKTFSIFYGAAKDEASANAAVAATSLELYTYGQPSLAADSATTGRPNTFIWGFRDVGGDPVFPTPVVPEVPLPAVLPLLGGLMAAAWMVRRRSLA